MSEAERLILIVDDEPGIRRFLRAALNGAGYRILEAGGGQEALDKAATDRPEMVILDLGLPDLDGIEVTRQLREWTQVPILILTVRDREADKIAALDAGADDYLTKPFSIGELMARLRAALRRTGQQPSAEAAFQTGSLLVDLAHRRVTLKGEEVRLTPTEYDLLRCLIVNAGKVLTHNYLLRQVWGPAYENEMHLLRVNMSNLRRKIEPDLVRPGLIQTDPGVGYRLNI